MNNMNAALKLLTRRHFVKQSIAYTSTAALLAACGGEGAGSAQTLRVYWNPGHAYDRYKEVIQQFEQDNPGWTVALEQYQWPDMRTKVLADFASGTVPDLIEEPGGWVQEFGTTGKLLSLQSYIEKDGEEVGFPDDWQTYAVERNTIDNQVYGIQLHLTCMLLFYNLDLFEQAGIKNPPTTWADFLSTAQELTRDNVYGFSINQDYSCSWPWLLQNGVRYYDGERNVTTLDNDAAYEALQFQADLIHKHKVSPAPQASSDYSGPQKLLSAQRAAMILSGPWDIKPILTSSPNLRWGIAQALTQKEQTTITAGTSLMIPKDAKHPDQAWDLLKRFVALDVEIGATREASMTMPRKSWGTNEEIQKMERIAPFAQGLNYAQSFTGVLDRTGKSGAINDLYKKAYDDAIYRNLPASQALQDFTNASKSVLQA